MELFSTPHNSELLTIFFDTNKNHNNLIAFGVLEGFIQELREEKQMSKSILQKKDGRCYLCMSMHGNEGHYSWIEEHHVFEGWANRKKSEHWGLKIYLCNEHHNQTNRESIHNNEFIETLVKKMAQTEFEKRYGHTKFMQEFGKNYLDEDKWIEPEPEAPKPKKLTAREKMMNRKTPEGFFRVDNADDIIFPIKADSTGQMSLVLW